LRRRKRRMKRRRMMRMRMRRRRGRRRRRTNPSLGWSIYRHLGLRSQIVEEEGF